MEEADLQHQFEALGFLPGDIVFNDPSAVNTSQLLNDLHSDPEVTDIRVPVYSGPLEGPLEAEQAQNLKEDADQAFKAKKYGKAVDLYTKALAATRSLTSVELKRTILANRAQTYIFYGDIHTALLDANLALSPQYTFLNSPKGVTMKCHFRRAKLFCMFARHKEALPDYEDFEKLRLETGTSMTTEHRNLKKDIDEGIQARGDRQRQFELIRAVDSRGIILRDNHRSHFPLPPRDILRSLGPDFDPDQMCLAFDTPSKRANLSLPDPNKTPIVIPVYISAPYFQPNPQRKGFRTREEDPVSEYDTIGSLLEGLFMSVLTAERNTSSSARLDASRSAIVHDSDHTSVVHVMTHRGRFLIIPRSTTFKDILAGARWPRDGPLPFEDGRITPRIRDFEVDGVELGFGWSIEVWVVPKDKWMEHCQFMDRDLNRSGTV